MTLGGNNAINPVVGFGMCLLFYPFLGWLADAKFGRYQIIRVSLLVLWVMSILFCLMFIVLNSVSLPMKVIKPVIYAPICLSMGGLLANILQFGSDQLMDASSGEITSFFRWFTWLWFVTGFLTGVSQSCLCSEYELLGQLVFPTLVTVAVASDFMFNHWLVKEAVSSNPLLVIFQVVRYAIKNKYPREWSAMAYSNDHSRIDFAKHKYGGPFTAVQVEDVKTFFRIISVLFAGTVVIALYLSVYSTFGDVMYHLIDEHFVQAGTCNSSYIANCFQRASVRYSGDIVLVVSFPVFEFVFYPWFKRVVRVSILRKVSIGKVFLLLSLAACTVIEFVANHRRLQEGNVTNMTCHLFSERRSEDERNSLPLAYEWVALPIILSSLGQFFILASAFEFLCAQSPYSMRGFLFGFAYGSVGLFTLLGYGILRSRSNS
jgi:peptide/histidine transporter 3/4